MQPNHSILDAHVHIHDCFDVSEFLDHAYENFALKARSATGNEHFRGILLLTESMGVDWYGKLRNSSTRSGDFVWNNWRIQPNLEDESVTAISRSSHELTIIAGRQIVTAERLEILALGLAREIADGQPIDEVMRQVQEAGALCVLPWGFGKWTGARGQIVRKILQEDQGPNFFLGDNAGRLSVWPAPAEFATAAEKQIRILPGTDPLPYAEQASSVGRFGAILDCELGANRPFEHLRRLLVDERVQPTPFGTLEKILPFMRNQIAMQLRKVGQ